LFFEDISEPGTDIFGAAVLRAPPDLRLIIAVKAILLMLHGVISFSVKNCRRGLLTGKDGQRRVQRNSLLKNDATSGWQ
jgi:hypothetical protein